LHVLSFVQQENDGFLCLLVLLLRLDFLATSQVDGWFCHDVPLERWHPDWVIAAENGEFPRFDHRGFPIFRSQRRPGLEVQSLMADSLLPGGLSERLLLGLVADKSG